MSSKIIRYHLAIVEMCFVVFVHIILYVHTLKIIISLKFVIKLFSATSIIIIIVIIIILFLVFPLINDKCDSNGHKFETLLRARRVAQQCKIQVQKEHSKSLQ